jgi:hypothetical protein
LDFVPVRRSVQEPLFNALLHAHHYLGYTQPVGEQLKYLVYAGGAASGLFCLEFGRAPSRSA